MRRRLCERCCGTHRLVHISADLGFGELVPFSEPAWYSAEMRSPYYNDSHRAFRQKMRNFVEKELKPFVDEWDEDKEVPNEVLLKAYEAGVYSPHAPAEHGGTPPPEGFDTFHDLIW